MNFENPNLQKLFYAVLGGVIVAVGIYTDVIPFSIITDIFAAK
jgi:hypothetical protein